MKRYRSDTPEAAIARKCLALAIGLMLAAPAFTQEKTGVRFKYEISSAELPQVINEISRRSGLQIVYDINLLRGTRAPAISGDLTVQQALDQALKGSGLSWTRVNGTTIRIALSRKKGKRATSVETNSPQSKNVEEQISTMPEVLVKGSRSTNTDIVRSENDIQPYVVFEREEIESSMALNIEQFLSARLPMNQTRGTGSRNQPEGYSGNRSQFNLRGLGPDQTLILINGRRSAGVSMLASAGNFDQPDLNGIPIAAVDRIEILPTSASAIYGGSATGGVINVILRSDYKGGQVRATYDNTFDTNSARRVVDFSGGFSFNGGMTSLVLSGSYSDANELLIQDRDFAERGRQLAERNSPESVYSYSSPIIGSQTNYSSSNGAPLVLKNGTSLGAAIGTVPVGYAGIASDGGAGLRLGAGTYDVSIPSTVNGGKQSLFATPTTKSIIARMRHEFSPAIATYLDVSKSANESFTNWAGFGTSTTLSATAPGNPFQQSIRVAYSLDGYEKPTISNSTSERANLGLVAELPKKWSLGLDLSWSKSTNEYTSANNRFDTTTVRNAITSGELNIFRDLSEFPADLTKYIIPSQTVYGPASAISREISVRSAGPIVEMPAGAMTLTGAVSSRSDHADGLFVGNGPYRYYPSRNQDAKSFYLETKLPLVSLRQGFSFLEELDVQASVRRDSYTTRGVPVSLSLQVPTLESEIPPYSYSENRSMSTDETVGFRAQFSKSLTLRASYGTGFLPPNVAQIASLGRETSVYLADPLRGGVPAFSDRLQYTSFGGSEDMRPERSVSTSMGLIYTPTLFDWFRLSVDYTRIYKKDEIALINFQEIINRESSFPGRILRGAKLPTDPEGWAGPIIAIDASAVNVARSVVEAFDIQADIEKDIGKFGYLHFYAVGAIQTKLDRAIVPEEPYVNRVGFNDGSIKVRANAGLIWKSGSWRVSTNTQYYDGYKVYSSFDAPVSADYSSMLQGARTIPSQNYTDVTVGYIFGKESSLSKLTFGIRNVFGSRPPTIASLDTRGGYSTYGDPRLRTYSISFEQNF